MSQENISVGIDISSTKVITCIGKSVNQGMIKGTIVDIEETVSAITASVAEAERMSGTVIQQAIIGINGAHIECADSKGVVAVVQADGEITEEDKNRAIAAAKAIPNRPNREILHTIPRNFIIDGQEEINNPVGMTGMRLEVNANIITASVNSIKSLNRAVEQSGTHVNEIVFSPIATSKILLTKRQMDIGVVLIDIGASTTSYAVYEEGNLLKCGVIPIGSMHITNDIAIGLRISIETADIIKLKYGYALPNKVSERDELDLNKISKSEEGIANIKFISEIIEARLNEIYYIIKKELSDINRDGILPAGIIITGGGSKIEGTIELAKSTLCLPVQNGKPIQEISGLIDKIDDPIYATSIGLMLWGKNKIGGGNSFPFDVGEIGGIIGKAKTFFKHLLP